MWQYNGLLHILQCMQKSSKVFKSKRIQYQSFMLSYITTTKRTRKLTRISGVHSHWYNCIRKERKNKNWLKVDFYFKKFKIFLVVVMTHKTLLQSIFVNKKLTKH